MSPQSILDLKMQGNDADAATIRDYLTKLLRAIWAGGEMFSGKRPFGNSGWEYDLYGALVKGGAIEGVMDEFQELVSFDEKAANAAIFSAIDFLGTTPQPHERE